jgi:hypothetical protein
MTAKRYGREGVRGDGLTTAAFGDQGYDGAYHRLVLGKFGKHLVTTRCTSPALGLLRKTEFRMKALI